MFLSLRPSLLDLPSPSPKPEPETRNPKPETRLLQLRVTNATPPYDCSYLKHAVFYSLVAQRHQRYHSHTVPQATLVQFTLCPSGMMNHMCHLLQVEKPIQWVKELTTNDLCSEMALITSS